MSFQNRLPRITSRSLWVIKGSNMSVRHINEYGAVTVHTTNYHMTRPSAMSLLVSSCAKLQNIPKQDMARSSMPKFEPNFKMEIIWCKSLLTRILLSGPRDKLLHSILSFSFYCRYVILSMRKKRPIVAREDFHSLQTDIAFQLFESNFNIL